MPTSPTRFFISDLPNLLCLLALSPSLVFAGRQPSSKASVFTFAHISFAPLPALLFLSTLHCYQVHRRDFWISLLLLLLSSAQALLQPPSGLLQLHHLGNPNLSALLHTSFASYPLDREGGCLPWTPSTASQPFILCLHRRRPSYLLRFFHRHIIQHPNSYSVVLPTCSKTHQASSRQSKAHCT